MVTENVEFCRDSINGSNTPAEELAPAQRKTQNTEISAIFCSFQQSVCLQKEKVEAYTKKIPRLYFLFYHDT